MNMNHFRSRRFLAVAVAVASMFVASCAAAPAPTDIHPSNPITFTGIGGVYPGQTAAKAASFGFPSSRCHGWCRPSADQVGAIRQ